MNVRATYRLQLHKHFAFRDAAALAPYLKRLGVSHVYLPPILTARKGSLHGYDVVDHSQISEELGGESGFRDMAACLRDHGMGIVLDIVPNHMAVGAENPWWRDVLENGAASRFANHFDIDWMTSDAELCGKVLVPFLDEPLEAAIATGKIRLHYEVEPVKFVLAYQEDRFPVRPEDSARLLSRIAHLTEPQRNAALSELTAPKVIAELLGRQHFVLAWWCTARHRINWRRFFDVNHLAALRVEEPAVFDAVHRVPLALYGEGLIDGLRVDHIDGLADPTGYCRRLREELSARAQDRAPRRDPAYLIVEKILAGDECLPRDWPVDGTTGYDFMNDISALQHARSGEAGLTKLWIDISGRVAEFESEEQSAREEVLRESFDSALRKVSRLFAQLAKVDAPDLSAPLFRQALTRLIGSFRVYRNYVEAEGPLPATFEEARIRAKRACTADLCAALDFIGGILARPTASALHAEAVQRFQQLCAPVAAKGTEDTALYRYGRDLSRNDVGFDPRVFALAPANFHKRCSARQETHPRSMLATATHDHKRGEDVRARLAVLSEMPATWERFVRTSFEQTASLRGPLIDAGDIYQVLQTIVGTWPLDLRPDDSPRLARYAERVLAWQQKALREAKLRSSWAGVQADAEEASRTFVTAILAPSCPFVTDLVKFVKLIAAPASANGLVQLALRCTVPGTPDTYQGCEFWDLSLVDPDNRSPVDFASRIESLEDDAPVETLIDHWPDGRIKQRLLATLLGFRAERPELFARGVYEPLGVRGMRAENVIAFCRKYGAQFLVLVATRCCADAIAGTTNLVPDRSWWDDTTIELPFDATARALLRTAPTLQLAGSVPVAKLLGRLPVAAIVLRD